MSKSNPNLTSMLTLNFLIIFCAKFPNLSPILADLVVAISSSLGLIYDERLGH